MRNRRILHAAVAFVLTSFGVLAGAATAPRLWGWEPLVITSGSMAPNVRVGDVVVVAPVVGSVRAGTVVTYRDHGSDRLITHRVVAVRPDGSYVTRGDANAQPDPTPVAPGEVVGEVRLLVPVIGLPATTSRTLTVAGLVLLVTIGALGTNALRKRPKHSSAAR